jgi:hypothetical protein
MLSSQALRKEPMTVYGDGKQTRSFQYISDLVHIFVSSMSYMCCAPEDAWGMKTKCLKRDDCIYSTAGCPS